MISPVGYSIGRRYLDTLYLNKIILKSSSDKQLIIQTISYYSGIQLLSLTRNVPLSFTALWDGFDYSWLNLSFLFRKLVQHSAINRWRKTKEYKREVLGQGLRISENNILQDYIIKQATYIIQNPLQENKLRVLFSALWRISEQFF